MVISNIYKFFGLSNIHDEYRYYYNSQCFSRFFGLFSGGCPFNFTLEEYG